MIVNQDGRAAEQDIIACARGSGPHTPSTEKLAAADTAGVSAISASSLRTISARKFTALTQTFTAGLAQASAAPYETVLAGLGEMAGAAVLQCTGADAEPDSV